CWSSPRHSRTSCPWYAPMPWWMSPAATTSSPAGIRCRMANCSAASSPAAPTASLKARIGEAGGRIGGLREKARIVAEAHPARRTLLMTRITLDHLDPELERFITERSARSGLTPDQVVIEVLRRASHEQPHPNEPIGHRLDHLAGGWSPEEFE